MSVTRFAPWIIAALLTSCLALWVTADASSSEPDGSAAETKALAQLAAVAAAHGHTVPDGLATYLRVGDAVVAHGPLDGITSYTDAEFEAGVLIMAVVVSEPTPGPIPNGSYVVQVKLEAGRDAGVATYFDAQGTPVARVPARARMHHQLHGTLPGADAAATATPRVVRTADHHYEIDCAGWRPYRVITY